LLAWHELQRPVGAKVQHGIGFEVFTQVAVERAERVRGGKAGFKQQAHRVAFIPEAWLHGHQHLTQLDPQHHQMLAVRQMLAWGWAPLRLDLVQPPFLLHML
jgi:hypothetical protein